MIDSIAVSGGPPAAASPAPRAIAPLSASTVAQLLGFRAYPSVSLLLTTRPGPGLHPDDRATLRRLADVARRRLSAEGLLDARRVLDGLDHLVEDAATGAVGHGLALFVSDAHRQRVDLPIPVVDRCVVDPTFAARDLLRALHRTPRHVVLLLAQAQACLLDGAAGHLSAAAGAAFPRTDRSRPARGDGARTSFLEEVDRRAGHVPAAAPRPAGRRRARAGPVRVPDALAQHRPPGRDAGGEPPGHPAADPAAARPHAPADLPAVPAGRSTRPPGRSLRAAPGGGRRARGVAGRTAGAPRDARRRGGLLLPGPAVRRRRRPAGGR